jgi:hypothetical protein
VTDRPQPKRSHGAAAGAGASPLTSVRTLRAQCRRPSGAGRGPAEARRGYKPTAERPASASRSIARSAARLHRLRRPCLLHRRLNGGARPRGTGRPAHRRRAGAGPSRQTPRCRASVRPGSRSHDMAATSAVAGAHGRRAFTRNTRAQARRLAPWSSDAVSVRPLSFVEAGRPLGGRSIAPPLAEAAGRTKPLGRICPP